MKRRATYETLVRDTILNPKDKINLPDREATLLRNTQQLSRYDDDDFLGFRKRQHSDYKAAKSANRNYKVAFRQSYENNYS